MIATSANAQRCHPLLTFHPRQWPGPKDSKPSFAPVAQTIALSCGCDLYRPGCEKGSEVSPCGFRQNELVQRQVKDRSAQPVILLLKMLEFLQLVRSHTAILLAPTVERLLSNLHLPDGIDARHSLSAQRLNLPQLRPAYVVNSDLRSSVSELQGQTNSKGEDHKVHNAGVDIFTIIGAGRWVLDHCGIKFCLAGLGCAKRNRRPTL